eukprot:ctg_493.g235
MSHAGFHIRTTGSNYLYDELPSPRSFHIHLRNCRPNEIGLTFPLQSESCSKVLVTLENNHLQESVLDAVIARALLCLRLDGNLVLELPKTQPFMDTSSDSSIPLKTALQPSEVALLCRVAGFKQVQVLEEDCSYIISCIKS